MKFAGGVALISTANQRHAPTSARAHWCFEAGPGELPSNRPSGPRALNLLLHYVNRSQDDSNGAAEAGMSPGNLYCYFPSKEALVAGIDERVPITKRRIESLVPFRQGADDRA
jgi:Bacterial regulatory proteins, tetR family